MAITRDAILTAVGGVGSTTSTTTLEITTVAAAAAGTWIIVPVSSFGAQTITGVADDGPGLAWAQIGSTATSSNGVRDRFYGAYASVGLASGKKITITFSSAIQFKWAGAVSYLGVVSATPLDIAAIASGAGSGTGQNGAPVTTLNANDVILSLVQTDGAGQPTSTPTSPWLEVLDGSISTPQSSTLVEQIVSATNTYTPAVTWSLTQTGGTQASVTISLSGATIVTKTVTATQAQTATLPRQVNKILVP